MDRRRLVNLLFKQKTCRKTGFFAKGFDVRSIAGQPLRSGSQSLAVQIGIKATLTTDFNNICLWIKQQVNGYCY